MTKESLNCKNCNAAFSDKAIANGIPFDGALIIRCDHCDSSAAYTPSNRTHTTIDSVGLEHIAEQLKLSRLDQIDRDARAEKIRIEKEEEERDERIFAELREVELIALSKYEAEVEAKRERRHMPYVR